MIAKTALISCFNVLPIEHRICGKCLLTESGYVAPEQCIENIGVESSTYVLYIEFVFIHICTLVNEVLHALVHCCTLFISMSIFPDARFVCHQFDNTI